MKHEADFDNDVDDEESGNSGLLTADIPPAAAGRRFDQVLAELFPDYSRSRLTQWIKEGRVRLDGKVPKPKDKVTGIESVELEPVAEADNRFQPQDIPLDIVYEDEAILVLNKPAGLVVHPAAGNPDGTLLNALLFHCPELDKVPRAGIVHRLDKDTTGLMVVAKTLIAQNSLVSQLQERSVTREYDAIVFGVLTGGGTIEEPMGRHHSDRKKMAVVPVGGKHAVTHYIVAERFRGHTHIKARLETGRTHQIRVHMAHTHHPLVGDTVYGGRTRLPRGASEMLREVLRTFPRQALHAARLALIHPVTDEPMEWQVPIAEDLAALIEALRQDATEAE